MKRKHEAAVSASDLGCRKRERRKGTTGCGTAVFSGNTGKNPAQERRKRESVAQRQLDLGSRGWVALAKGGRLRGKVAGLEQQERMTAVEEVKPGMGLPLGMTEQREGEQH